MRRTRALGLALFVVGCGHQRTGGVPHVPVTVARAVRRPMPYEIVGTGTVEPAQTAAVQSQVTGILSTIDFAEGADVEAGQVLFRIDPRPFQAALDQARATLTRDVAEATSADRDATRWTALVKQDYVTQSDADGKRAAAAAADATVEADSAALETAELNLQWATIRAPISGRTGRLLLREGNLVRANTDQLVVINQIHPILVQFAVPEQQLPLIQRHRTGERLPVLASPSKTDTTFSEGILSFLDNTVDTTTGTVLLKAEFPNRDNTLWPGEFLNVRLRLYIEDSALVVPAQAVMTGQQGTYLFVVNPDGTARAQPVTVERTVDPYTILASGVQPGDQVVTDGQSRLVSGTQVEVKGSAGGMEGDR